MSTKEGFAERRLKLLYAGAPWQYEDFMGRFELSPTEVKYVDSLEDLYGFKDLTLVYAPGFQLVLDDKYVSGYCRTHGIGMIPEGVFTNQYNEGHYNE